ncbi:MAG: stage II sporulation protein M [Anaerolineae bacterium]
MHPEKFLQLRETDWKQLERLLNQAVKKPDSLSTNDAEQLGQLYRTVTSDLALAQRDFPKDRVTVYLNQLVGRSHALIYQKRGGSWQKIWHYFKADIPIAFRTSLPYFFIALFLFFAPAILAGVLTWIDPDLARFLLPPGAQQLIPQIEEGLLWTEISEDRRPFFSAIIATNNIRVTFLAFAGGILAGLLTIFVMIVNGLMLGGLLGLTFHYGIGWGLTEFVVGHGVVELSVIVMAGGAGLMLGWSILQPGLISRGDALRLAAQDAIKLVVASVPLLLIAALIEGFISPNEFIPFGVKVAVGLISGAFMYAWLLLGGRKTS